MLARAAEHGVAPITWQELGGQKDLVAFSHGKLLACACSCLFQEHLYCAWQELGEQQDLVAFSHGPMEASSHVETTLTQLVQQLVVEAQVRRLERQHGLRLSPTELLANSLGKLAAGVQQLEQGLAAAAPAAASGAMDGPTGAPAGSSGNSNGNGSGGGPAPSSSAPQGSTTTSSSSSGGGSSRRPAMMLFAGRRSSSRRFLLLQNW
ncbi:hypothetical protein COHA_009187 [Chlorella ohadii]|uniref:Uncharacterized protein n=1 Tax=Chlorella ohadii TaxID=2649997 RepID=A0AAD5H2I9_9CHLO|nr:hypothetical protein COHA_009187 [Chlorella ohadii]